MFSRKWRIRDSCDLSQRSFRPQLFQIQGVRDSTPPARLPIALEHPKILTVGGSAVDKALPVRRHAETNARTGCIWLKVLAQVLNDLPLERHRVKRKEYRAVLNVVGFAGLYSVEQLPIFGKCKVRSRDLAEEFCCLTVGRNQVPALCILVCDPVAGRRPIG